MNLSVTNLFFELALIFLPGFVWMKIHRKYGAKGELTQFDAILNAFIFGVISYAVLLGVYRLAGKTLNIMSLDVDSKKLLQADILPEICYALVIAIIGGIVNLYGEHYKIFTRFVQFIGATKTYGDEDVWDFVFNSQSKSVRFVHVRDFEQKVVYAGYVRVFSESGKTRELVLTSVEVFDFDGNRMYDVPSLYLAREPESVHIEFPIAE